MVKQNLGKLDRIFRFALGLWIFSPFSPDFFGPVGIVLTIIGLISLLESFLGYCALHDWLSINNRNQ